MKKNLIFLVLFLVSITFKGYSATICQGASYTQPVNSACFSFCASLVTTWSITASGSFTITSPSSIAGTYSGSANLSTSSSQGCSNISISFASVGSASVTSNAGSCGSRNESHTIVAPGTPPTLSGDFSNLCESTTRTFSATPAGGTWSVVGGSGTINSSTGLYTPANISSDVSVTLRYSINACTFSDVTFLVNAEQTVGWSPTSGHICENQTNLLVPSNPLGSWTVVSGGGTVSGNTYTPPNISIARQQIAITRGQPAGSGCTGPNNTSGFEVYGIADNTTDNSAICEGATKTLIANPAGGTWSVVSGGGTISGTTYTSPLVSSNTVVTIRYTYDNPEVNVPVVCDITTSDVSFTVNDNLGTANNTTSIAAICEGSTKSLTATPAGGTWSVVSGGGSITGTTYNTPVISADAIVTVRYSIAAGVCPATSSDVVFTVNDNLGTASNTTSTAAICEGSTKALSATPAGGTWSVVSGGGTISGTTYNSPVITSNTAVTVRYTIAANGACPATTSDVAFTVNDNLGTATNTTSTAAICEGSTKSLTATPAGGTWSVVSGGGSITGTTYNSPVISSDATVVIRYTIATNGACPGSTSDVSFTVNDNLGTANNTASTAAICEGSTKALTATPAGGVWSVVSGGGTISGTTYNSPVISSNTTVTVRYTIAANGACPATINDAVFTVNDNLGTANNTTSTAAICEGSTKALTATPAGGVWSVVSGGGTISGTIYNSPVISSDATVTVRYTVAANGACPATTSDVAFTVNDNLGTASNTTSTASICEGSTKTLIATPAGGSWSVISGGGTISGTTYNSPVISSDATVTVRYTVAANGACPATTSDVAFTVNDNLGTANNTTSATAICEGSTKALTATPAGGTWSVVSGGGTISGTTYNSPVISSDATVTVRYTVPANGACPATTSDVVFTVNDNLGTANNATNTTAICEGDTKALSATPAGGSWSVTAGGGTISGTTYTSPAVSSNSNVTVRYTIAANGACPASTSDVTFTVNDNPGAPSNTTSTASICEGDTKALTASPAGGSWSVVSGGGTITGTTYTSPSVSSNTTVTVGYTIPPNGSCPALTADVIFTVNDNLGAPSNNTSIAAICEGSTKPLTASPAGGSWSVLSGGGSISGATYTSPAVSSNTTVTVAYTIAANGACPAASSNVSFDVNDNIGAAVNTTSNTSICENDSKTLVGSPAGGTWTIISGGGAISGTNYTNTPISSNSVVTIQYAMPVNGACPASTDDVVFTVFDNVGPVVINTSNTSICAGDTKVLDATTAGGVWSITSGSGTISGSNYNSNGALSATETIALTYTLTNGACSISGNLSFTVNPIPGTPAIASVSADSICVGQNTTLTATNSGSGTLAWYPSNVPSGAPLNSGSTFNVSPTVTTTYYVFGNSSGACYSGSYDSTIIVVSAPSVAAALITASSSSVCSGETVTLAVNGGSLAAGADWFWYSGSCGTTFVGQGNSITVSPTANTTYFVRAEGGTCGSSSCTSVAISIQNSVSASFAIPSLICVTTTSVDLNQYLSSSATTGGTWSGVSLTSGAVINPSTLGVGTFTVKYKVGTSPCVDSLSQTFSIVAPSASLNAQNDSYVILESQAGLFSVTTNDLPSTLMITSIGSPVNGTASIVGNQISYTSNTDFRGLDSMTYSACDSICVSSCSNAIVYIQVDSDVIDGGNGTDGNGNVGGWILTPNGDGKDDVFYIDGLYGYLKNEIAIFNRWGDEVFSASPYKNDWNASSPKDVVSGTYFFILKLTLMDNTEKVVKGFIQVEK